jgi:hypothetical protein
LPDQNAQEVLDITPKFVGFRLQPREIVVASLRLRTEMLVGDALRRGICETR